jgi:hypothetical protein
VVKEDVYVEDGVGEEEEALGIRPWALAKRILD